MFWKKITSWFQRKEKKVVTFQAPTCMNIQEFVKDSITGIMTGIRDSQKVQLDGNSAYDALICPAWGPLGSGSRGHADKIHELEFDLAVTVTESSSSMTEGQAKITVGVYNAGLGASAETSGAYSTVSRIRFRIPVRYPLTKLSVPVYDEVKKDP